jgi:hypothetical protein
VNRPPTADQQHHWRVPFAVGLVRIAGVWPFTHLYFEVCV